MRDFAEKIIRAARELGATVDRIKFTAPVTHVYNPLVYAWRAHDDYLRRFGNGRKRVVFLGMNPGPFGMVQTGVPFGEISSVRSWMRIETAVGRPRREHSKRPVKGFDCPRSEVSGKRLWGLFAARFGSAENFFAHHFVVNYCPLAFFDRDGRNLTPDKLPARQTAALFAACDLHLRRTLETLRPEWLVGIGDFAEKRAQLLFLEASSLRQGPGLDSSALGVRKSLSTAFLPREAAGRRTRGQMAALRIGKILHPSPASPAANKDWARKATNALKALGIWT